MTENSAAAAASVEQHISFQGKDGIPIAGTLVLPEPANSDRLAPAVLLIQGSGPTDRDGNQPPNLQTDLLRQLADILAGAGIASLRYDKRGMHENRDSFPKHQNELSDFFSWSAFVDDAHAAFAFLVTHPGIASDRVGVLGHSEGGCSHSILPLNIGRSQNCSSWRALQGGHSDRSSMINCEGF